MQLDYQFLKNILEQMESNNSHLYSSVTLATDVLHDLKDERDFDKFAGHIKVLGDNGCIDCKSENYGFTRSMGGWHYFDTEYRLTSQGYEFLDMLKNQTVFNKIKDYSISTALDVGKALLIATIKTSLNAA